jgi:hypothetical protein
MCAVRLRAHDGKALSLPATCGESTKAIAWPALRFAAGGGDFVAASFWILFLYLFGCFRSSGGAILNGRPRWGWGVPVALGMGGPGGTFQIHGRALHPFRGRFSILDAHLRRGGRDLHHLSLEGRPIELGHRPPSEACRARPLLRQRSGRRGGRNSASTKDTGRPNVAPTTMPGRAPRCHPSIALRPAAVMQ